MYFQPCITINAGDPMAKICCRVVTDSDVYIHVTISVTASCINL